MISRFIVGSTPAQKPPMKSKDRGVLSIFLVTWEGKPVRLILNMPPCYSFCGRDSEGELRASSKFSAAPDARSLRLLPVFTPSSRCHVGKVVRILTKAKHKVYLLKGERG